MATPLKNLLYSPIEHFPYLLGLSLAHPITHTSEFEIGIDFYWSIVEDQTICGDGPTAVQSQLGYLLSGPTTSTQTVDKTLQMSYTVVQPIEESIINKFWDVESTGTLSNTELSSNSQFLAPYIKSSVEYQSDGSYIHSKVPMEGQSPFSPF